MFALRMAGIAGFLTVPVLLAALLSGALFPVEAGRFGVPVIVIIFLITAIVLFGRRLLVAIILSIALTALTAIFADSVMLNLWGEKTTTTTVEHRAVWNGKRPDTHHYKLANVSGELSRRSPELQVGSKVTVIHDPHGLANPMDPQQVEREKSAGTWLTLGWLVMCVASLFSRSRSAVRRAQ